MIFKKIKIKYTCNVCRVKNSFIKKLKNNYYYSKQPYCSFCGSAMFAEIIDRDKNL